MSNVNITEIPSPFHRGELAIQERLGVREKVHSYAPRVIRDHMPQEHRDFFTQLPQLIIGSVDDRGRPWASMIVGRPGFIASSGPKKLSVSACPLYGDPLGHNLNLMSPLGFLGIEFHSRRRNRMNGKLTKLAPDGFEITVDQSFGNCPQYIQARGFELTNSVDEPQQPRPITRSPSFSPAIRDAVNKADTFFIASIFSEDDSDRSHGVDVSHRGGRPGFVQIMDDKTLLFPDFAGNSHFNTLGNISLNPHVGLLFPDFATGNIIYLTGRAEVIWDGPELDAFVGAERLVRFTLDEGIQVEDSLPFRSQFHGYSASLEKTGSWQDVSDLIEVNQQRNIWRPFTVAQIEKESETITSFYLTPEDGKPLASHDVGQFLPIRVNIPGQSSPANRTYTVSETPNGKFYRLSIKRENQGLVSRYFHDEMTLGTVIEAMAPRGAFTLEKESHRPVVLLSGGVGVTPMIAMLDYLLLQGARTGEARPVHFIHGTRNGREHAFGAHVKKLAEQVESFTAHIRYSNPDAEDQIGMDYDSKGYIDAALLQSLLPLNDYDFYLCGPGPFMETLYNTLVLLGVAEGRIHYESFGPAMVLKKGDADAENKTEDKKARVPHQEPVSVFFGKSNIEALWQPEKGSLLDLAEAEGLTPPYSCRSGVCGSCVTKVKSGNVGYSEEPVAPRQADEALICCSIPKVPSDTEGEHEKYGLVLDL